MILALLLYTATLPRCTPETVLLDAPCRWPIANVVTWQAGRTYNTPNGYIYCRKGECWNEAKYLPTSTPTPVPTSTPVVPTATPRYPTPTPGGAP